LREKKSPEDRYRREGKEQGQTHHQELGEDAMSMVGTMMTMKIMTTEIETKEEN
jgi:hypothetical protein